MKNNLNTSFLCSLIINNTTGNDNISSISFLEHLGFRLNLSKRRPLAALHEENKITAFLKIISITSYISKFAPKISIFCLVLSFDQTYFHEICVFFSFVRISNNNQSYSKRYSYQQEWCKKIKMQCKKTFSLKVSSISFKDLSCPQSISVS